MSNQIFDKQTKLRTPQTFAAVHIIKGALSKKFSTFLTVGTKFESKVKGIIDLLYLLFHYNNRIFYFIGRVIVEYDGPTPDNSTLKDIESLSNKIVKDNVSIEVLELPRSEAENRFKDLVNGQFIYEKRRPPENIDVLTIVHIPDWTICCSPTKDICKSTGDVGYIQILRYNHRPQKKELEVCFQLTGMNNQKEEGKVKDEKSNTAQVKQVDAVDDVNSVVDRLYNLFLSELNRVEPSHNISEEKLKTLHEKFTFKASNMLTAFKNASYSKGLFAKQV